MFCYFLCEESDAVGAPLMDGGAGMEPDLSAPPPSLEDLMVRSCQSTRSPEEQTSSQNTNSSQLTALPSGETIKKLLTKWQVCWDVITAEGCCSARHTTIIFTVNQSVDYFLDEWISCLCSCCVKCQKMVKHVNECFPKSPRWRPQMSCFVHNSKIFSFLSQRREETRTYSHLTRWHHTSLPVFS